MKMDGLRKLMDSDNVQLAALAEQLHDTLAPAAARHQENAGGTESDEADEEAKRKREEEAKLSQQTLDSLLSVFE